MKKFKNIGELIAALRRDNNMTQLYLGTQLNIGRVALSKIENSQRAISLDEVMQISKIFGISIDTLFSYVQEEPEEDDNSFVMAFRSRGIVSEEDLKEIREVELLVDALYTQEQIYRGE